MNSKPENYIRVLLDEKGTIIEFECNFKEKDVPDISVIGKNWFDTFINANNTKEIEEVFRYLLLNGDSKKWKTYANTIKIGNKADLTIFNPRCKYTFSKIDILSTSKNSAFLGKELKGKAYGIFANNQLVLKD